MMVKLHPKRVLNVVHKILLLKVVQMKVQKSHHLKEALMMKVQSALLKGNQSRRSHRVKMKRATVMKNQKHPKMRTGTGVLHKRYLREREAAKILETLPLKSKILITSELMSAIGALRLLFSNSKIMTLLFQMYPTMMSETMIIMTGPMKNNQWPVAGVLMKQDG